jgi:hypothetical protein
MTIVFIRTNIKIILDKPPKFVTLTKKLGFSIDNIIESYRIGNTNGITRGKKLSFLVKRLSFLHIAVPFQLTKHLYVPFFFRQGKNVIGNNPARSFSLVGKREIKNYSPWRIK